MVKHEQRRCGQKQQKPAVRYAERSQRWEWGRKVALTMQRGRYCRGRALPACLRLCQRQWFRQAHRTEVCRIIFVLFLFRLGDSERSNHATAAKGISPFALNVSYEIFIKVTIFKNYKPRVANQTCQVSQPLHPQELARVKTV